MATTMPLFANAQEGDNEPAHQLYGGHDAGALLSKSLMVTSQLDWLNAWSLNLEAIHQKICPKAISEF
ncbi:hypothetical protein HSBAA_PA_4020 (plasmid) [Vreelandella sulfidaeris]|uniref:Uncharacterized protein n=1 Tax=Vreelandella sulfidaeris TaxID=115553 RepID=A0A455UNJ4_9GAMM|nr:hypothetical protein HSBAA_PA_4020 [Halomonas sulfidaeris]